MCSSRVAAAGGGFDAAMHEDSESVPAWREFETQSLMELPKAAQVFEQYADTNEGAMEPFREIPVAMRNRERCGWLKWTDRLASWFISSEVELICFLMH